MRLLNDDYQTQNPLALLTTEKLAALSDAAAADSQYLAATGLQQLTVADGIVFVVGNTVFKTTQTTIGVADLDAGAAFTLGKDYYVYICNTDTAVTATAPEVYKISQNATYPAGFSADNSRKIGGFHFGVVRGVNNSLQPVNASGVVKGSGWEANVSNGILPRSVWTLGHRPKCNPEGMVFVSDGLWADIYLSSDNGAGGLASVRGATPLTGTEGFNALLFNEAAMKVGKRLLTLNEWFMVAYGSPTGADGNNTNAWAATTNTARCACGNVQNAVSAIGAVDCVGNVWEWLDEYVMRTDGTVSWAYQDVVSGYGKMYMPNATALIALIAGGNWASGVVAGARALTCASYPWSVPTGVGVRAACQSLR